MRTLLLIATAVGVGSCAPTSDPKDCGGQICLGSTENHIYKAWGFYDEGPLALDVSVPLACYCEDVTTHAHLYSTPTSVEATVVRADGTPIGVDAGGWWGSDRTSTSVVFDAPPGQLYVELTFSPGGERAAHNLLVARNAERAPAAVLPGCATVQRTRSGFFCDARFFRGGAQVDQLAESALIATRDDAVWAFDTDAGTVTRWRDLGAGVLERGPSIALALSGGETLQALVPVEGAVTLATANGFRTVSFSDGGLSSTGFAVSGLSAPLLAAATDGGLLLAWPGPAASDGGSDACLGLWRLGESTVACRAVDGTAVGASEAGLWVSKPGNVVKDGSLELYVSGASGVELKAWMFLHLRAVPTKSLALTPGPPLIVRLYHAPNWGLPRFQGVSAAVDRFETVEGLKPGGAGRDYAWDVDEDAGVVRVFTF